MPLSAFRYQRAANGKEAGQATRGVASTASAFHGETSLDRPSGR